MQKVDSVTTTAPTVGRLAWLNQGHIVALAAVLFVAFAVRLVCVVAIAPDPEDGRFDDTVWYHGSAKLLSQGRSYLNPYNEIDTAKWPVGYPLALSLVYRLPGDDVTSGRLFNVLVGTVTVLGVYLLVERLWSRKAGLVAAGVFALWPSHVLFASLLLSETLYTGFVVWILYFVVRLTLDRERPPPLWWLVGLGAAIAASGMVRGEGTLLVLLPIVAWAVAHRSLKRVALYAAATVAGMVIVLTPWTVRNWVDIGEPIYGTTGVGGVLFQAHNHYADGEASIFTQRILEEQFLDIAEPERELRINSEGIKQSLTWARNNIQRELELSTNRFAYFYRGDMGVLKWIQVPDPQGRKELSMTDQHRLENLSDAYYYVAIGLTLFGLPMWFVHRKTGHLMLLGLFLYYTFLWTFFFCGEPRYHAPLNPLFAMGAAIGLLAAMELPRLYRSAAKTL